MSSAGVPALPADLLHLLATELSDRLDFTTLYNCVVSSKHLASSGAVNALYRISHEAPVKGGDDRLSLADQEQTTQRWSIMWRTIILSTFGKTVFPYCRHLRFLDLLDLSDLLEDDRFRGKIAKEFFSGELQQFHHVQHIRGKNRHTRLDTKKIVTAIGDRIVQHAPLLEELSESANADILSTALLNWTPHLSHLRSLDFGDGKALANETVRNLLLTHCRNLDTLRIYHASNEDADHTLAAFISEMPENSLIYFETISNCRIGPETCLALNRHGKSLRSLKLGLDAAGIQALGLLQNCTAVEILALSSAMASPDLKATENDVYLDILGWLKSCNNLKDVSFTNIVSAPDLLLPVLLNSEVQLEKLQINAPIEGAMYVVQNHPEFHQALRNQRTLSSLLLRADPDPPTRDDIETLVNSVCALGDLRELSLTRISDYFTDEHIQLLTDHLSNLEDLYVGGYAVTDAIWPSVAKLQNLRTVTFSGISKFTENGILDFIDRLGDGVRGILLSIENADPDAPISEDSQELIRDVMATKLDGRFEYQLLRGMLLFTAKHTGETWANHLE
ncbi:uncharacterized protein MYCGRDRAFT_67873 [Zymoseptoria tritici IPO323]|uniref:F-box domain-containing protein n=1 Tax=Zymoseptoria tritici (strain CBS 115943 / IPO323) TaxID=336722 RepID=F9X444_ZYMTI|nr:uncharacterized protein MYCGRDRAFT_67873 [Zymoseptoria tritici IPO323]EGP89757.1 hypothetical protein MYCGRDRAFT_67873 [Zymoseptoria tritici IPO323]